LELETDGLNKFRNYRLFLLFKKRKLMFMKRNMNKDGIETLFVLITHCIPLQMI